MGGTRNLELKTAKAQVSVEMLVILSILMIVFIVGLTLFTGFRNSVDSARSTLASFQAASALGSAVNSVYLAGDGTTFTVYVEQVDGNATISGSSLLVQSGDAAYSWPLLTNSTSSPANITLGNMRIRNSAGIVYVENI